MDTTSPNNDQTLEPEQAAAKAAILAECEQLAAAGVTFVEAHFDGSGDEGVTGEVKCYKAEEYSRDEDDPVAYDASRLQEHFEALVPYGYQDNCGGFGDVVLNVKVRRITVERNDRFEDYSTSSYEV
jgi:hypothetical protein